MPYDIGDIVRISAEFKNQGGQYVDPGQVRAKIRDPRGVITTYVYGVDAEVVKEAIGKYYLDFVAVKSGSWCTRFEGTGDNRGAAERDVFVDASCFYKPAGQEIA